MLALSVSTPTHLHKIGLLGVVGTAATVSEERGDPSGQRGREGASSLECREEARGPQAVPGQNTRIQGTASGEQGEIPPKRQVTGPKEKQVTPPTPPTAHPLSPLLGYGGRQAWIWTSGSLLLAEEDIKLLMKMALDKIAFIPFSFLTSGAGGCLI